MAQQKMHVALLRNHTGIGKFSRKSNSSSTESPEEDKPRNSVRETSFFFLKSAAECAYVTCVTFGSDGRWTRILSLPAECFGINRGLIDMDLCLVSPAPIIPFSVNHPKYLRSIWHAYSANPVAEAKLSGIVRQCSQQKALSNKGVKPNVSPCSRSAWSDSMPGTTDTNSLSENFKVPRRKSKKKTKKKKNQSKKLHSDAGLVGADALSIPFSSDISTSEPFADYVMELDVSALSTADLVDSSFGICDTRAVSGVSPACVMDTHLNMGYQSGSQAFETEGFVHIGAAKDTLRQPINWLGCDTEVSYGNHDSIVSDSGFTGLNSIDSEDTICDVTNNTRFVSPETSAFAENSVSSESSSIISVEFDTHNKEKKICSNEICSSEAPMYGKRGNSVSSMPGRYSNKRTAHGHFGKENLHSVWKKVHKTDSCGLYSMEKNNNMNSGFGATSREKPRHEVYGKYTTKLSAADNSNDSHVQISRRPRNRITPESQQKSNCQSGKEYHPKKDRSSMVLKLNPENGRSFNDAAQKKIKQARGFNSRYQNPPNGTRELQNKIDCTTRTSVPGTKVQQHGPVIPKRSLTSNGKIENSEVKYKRPTKSEGSIELSNCLGQSQPGNLDVNDDDICMGREAPLATNEKTDYSSGFVLQKWIPVGRKVPCPTGLERSETSLLLHFDKPGTENGCSKIMAVLSSDSITSITSEVEESSPIFEKLHGPEEGISQVKETTSETTVTSDSNTKFVSFVGGVEDVLVSSTDVFLEKVTSAVDDTFRVQLESEAVQTAIGTPTPGFEKFLHSACPVILKVDGAFKCQRCHVQPAAISFHCTHELQSICLRSIWEWYERHGSYGLEVREDRYDDPMNIGHREFGSRAYFVPYLSAVQLFRKCKNGYVNGLKHLHPGIPHPCTDAVRLSLPDQSCSFHPSCESVDIMAPSAVSTGSYELIFEYFESEQPRRRQPLFEMINELAAGEGLQEQVYGDPEMLTSSDIRDLHPRSWYSVAWYPIYKIPDGNFRAAFLTYHSLGHLFHRETSSNSQVEIVSPIVGLLSCNAQCEGWLHPMDCKAQKAADTTNLSLPETIKERLRTLEHTASLFSTSTVCKGNITSVNSHPDYNFFTSRRR